jgi:purine-binding chemotaxis protein CheW
MTRGPVTEAAGQAAAARCDDHRQYLTFMLGSEVFALGILHIKEIIEYDPPTAVPMMPGFIRGVVNLRGAVVPVVDLSRRFDRESTPVSKRACIVIVELVGGSERHTMGLIVDAVNEVLEIPQSDIEPSPEFGATVRTDFIAGMGKVKGRFVMILQVSQVLAMEDLDSLARASVHSPVLQ